MFLTCFCLYPLSLVGVVVLPTFLAFSLAMLPHFHSVDIKIGYMPTPSTTTNHRYDILQLNPK